MLQLLLMLLIPICIDASERDAFINMMRRDRRLGTVALKVKVSSLEHDLASTSDDRVLHAMLRSFDDLHERYLSMSDVERRRRATELIIMSNVVVSSQQRVDWDKHKLIQAAVLDQVQSLRDEILKLTPFAKKIDPTVVYDRYDKAVAAAGKRDVKLVVAREELAVIVESSEDYKGRIRRLCNGIHCLERDMFLSGVIDEHEDRLKVLQKDFDDCKAKMSDRGQSMIQDLLGHIERNHFS